MQKELKRKAKKIKLIALDVDGVLTDGRIILTSDGDELKCFHAQDGQGIKLAQKAGIRFAFITGRSSKLVNYRARELDINEVYQDVRDKVSVFRGLLHEYELGSEQCAYIGDDVGDLSLLKEVGLAITVADGVKMVKDIADYVTGKEGGRGAVREAIDLILSCQKEE